MGNYTVRPRRKLEDDFKTDLGKYVGKWRSGLSARLIYGFCELLA